MRNITKVTIEIKIDVAGCLLGIAAILQILL